MDLNLEEQKDELLALQSILESHVFSFYDLAGELKIQANLTHPVIKLITPLENVGDQRSMQDYEVQHLPPIVLSFTFPETYPSHSPPDYTLSCIWLSRQKVSN